MRRILKNVRSQGGPSLSLSAIWIEEDEEEGFIAVWHFKTIDGNGDGMLIEGVLPDKFLNIGQFFY